MNSMDEVNHTTVPFEPEAIKEYLDESIRIWRYKRDNDECNMAVYYIDAFQSIRASLFGELYE